MSAAQINYLQLLNGMQRRSRRREPCPTCGKLINANGMWLHTRACGQPKPYNPEDEPPRPILREFWGPELLECDRLIAEGLGDVPRRCWKCGVEGKVEKTNGFGAFRCLNCRGKWGM